jgi:predicted RNA binding protein with dsRBD fold (UPF0201 family)
VNLAIRALVKPTEDADRIMKAIQNIFPDAELEVVGNEVSGTASSLERFGELLRSQKIRDAARGVLLRSISGNEIRFLLNKQVAFMGKVNFDSEGPLGNIEVVLVDEGIEGLIDKIAPRTAETD